ncbi:UvrD-helicase domain-containing protein [Sorangium sp. So ce117]|uniref:UvrD-helicase domain-containing protein n=1 Tax=Sorangium sp. So ce117 TaxID=3133277 RepID=UPI003F5FA29D
MTTMQVAIARDYFPAYARLPRKAQHKADEFLRKFTTDSTQASIHYEPIRGAQDKQLRSVRIGDDYRAIVRAPERGDVFVLLWVDHHDEAYRWAASKRTAVHPATGTLQLYDLDAAAHVVTSLGTAQSVDAASTQETRPAKGDIERPVSAPDTDGARLFAGFTDDDLFHGGVPRALLPAVRAVASEAELDQLAPHLPAEAAEVLTGLAAGLALDAVLEEILGRGAPKGPEAKAEVDPADVAAALERPSTQQQFRLLGADFDLESALAHPLDVWRVYLHPRQRVLARARTKGPMRVTGGAGTGKTVVALHRAAFLVRDVFVKPDDRLLFTTFTVNLAFDLRRQLEKLLEPHELSRVDVKNIDGWASEYLRSRGEHVRLATNEMRDQAWRRVMDIYAVPNFGLEFCKTEWRDVVQAQDLHDEEAYVRAVRLSRGVPLGRRERRLLWPLFRAYRQELEGLGQMEPIEIVRRARQRVEVDGGPARYRAVVVDETQDFSLEALRLVRALAGPEHPDDLFLVGDAHQRIYGRPVALSSAGINVRGRRSQELRLNYRTTAAICRWSLGALGGEQVDDLDEGTASRRGYVSLREGQAPSVHSFEYAADEVAFVVGEVRRLLASGTPPEGICIAARSAFALRDRFLDALIRDGIPADLIDREEPRHPSVRLATMHRIKGLEFPVVFVVGVNADEVPFRSPELESDDPVVAHRAEVAERCLLYVAASRARDALFVTSWGTPSPFLAAMGPPPAAVSPRRPTVRPAAASSLPPPSASIPPAPAAVAPELPAPEPAAVAETPASPAFTEQSATPLVATTPPAAKPGETPLLALSLPVRFMNWAEKKGLTTLGELSRIPPRDLLAERNLGRKTLAETRVVLEAALGCSWEEAATEAEAAARAPAASDASLQEDPFTSKQWDVMRLALPDALASARIDDVDLPTRVVTYARAEGIETIPALAARSKATLLSAKNMGRASIPALVEALQAHMERLDGVRRKMDAGLLESWKALLQEQDAVRRMVFTRRAGLGAPSETLQSIGETLGVSRERARQLENAVLVDLGRERLWLGEIRRRFEAALNDGVAALDTLAEDPWWTGIAAMPAALDYLGERLLDGAMRVVDVDERAYLGRCAQAVFDDAAAELRRKASEMPLPSPLSAFRALADEHVSTLGKFLADVAFERLRERLHVEQAEDGAGEEPGAEARVLGFGAGTAAAVLAALRASPTPMRVEDLTERLGRCNMPDEVLFFDRGLVGLEQHFPDFRGWMDRVVPPVLEVLQREPPERQWLANEILDELAESVDLPEWLDHWHLAALLRKSGRMRYLGRNRFALLDAPDERGRIHYRDELVRILRDHGGPMVREDVIAALRKKTTAPIGTVSLNLLRPPFVSCDAERVGLLERDLPGGAAALVEALEHVAVLLERRARGLGASQLKAEVSRLSQSHAQWSLDMCMSVLRGDPRFRLSQSGAVGLMQWESVRVPTRAEIVRQCLDEAEGHVSVEAVQRRIEAYYGNQPDRIVVGALANRFGAVLRGDWLQWDAGASQAPREVSERGESAQ